MGGVRGSYSWVDDDFIDLDSNSMAPLELDPWNPAMFRDDTSWRPPDESGTEPLKVEYATATSWDIGDLRDNEPFDQWDDASGGAVDWVEPDPSTGAISGLGESLYPPDKNITDISRELKIGKFLTLVAPCTQEQRARCHELLSACGLRRLRRLIPWLCKRAWCGEKLQLFLEFRAHWELNRNARWWEFFYWSHFDQVWIPQYFPATLTLEYTMELVEKRVGCVVSEVIGQGWFADWENCAAWEHGIRSFASFAVLRAGFPNGNQWQEYLGRHDRRTALEIAQCMDPDFAPFMLPSMVRQYSCPQVVDARTDPWPDVTEMANQRAAALGGNVSQAWEEIVHRITGF